MVFLHINRNEMENSQDINSDPVSILKKLIHSNNKNKTFMLIYMEGCGPCNNVRPEWKKIENVLKELNNRNDIAVVDIDKDLYDKVNYIKTNSPRGFPTIRYITNKGNLVENYEDSNVKNKDRSIDSFVEWIKLKMKDGKPSKNNKTYKKIKGNKTKKYYGGKWSLKYKKSINCKNPKGFSQKQYCKYGRKNKQ